MSWVSAESDGDLCPAWTNLITTTDLESPLVAITVIFADLWSLWAFFNTSTFKIPVAGSTFAKVTQFLDCTAPVAIELSVTATSYETFVLSPSSCHKTTSVSNWFASIKWISGAETAGAPRPTWITSTGCRITLSPTLISNVTVALRDLSNKFFS